MWKVISTAKNGRTLWWDEPSHIYAICEVGEFPEDRSANVFGITPDNKEWAERIWRYARMED